MSSTFSPPTHHHEHAHPHPRPASLSPEDRLRLFLMQYWGGPRTYSMRRGHPRLRMRHAPFKIGPRERDAWLRHMRDALDEVALPPELETATPMVRATSARPLRGAMT